MRTPRPHESLSWPRSCKLCSVETVHMFQPSRAMVALQQWSSVTIPADELIVNVYLDFSVLHYVSSAKFWRPTCLCEVVKIYYWLRIVHCFWHSTGPPFPPLKMCETHQTSKAAWWGGGLKSVCKMYIGLTEHLYSVSDPDTIYRVNFLTGPPVNFQRTKSYRVSFFSGLPLIWLCPRPIINFCT